MKQHSSFASRFSKVAKDNRGTGSLELRYSAQLEIKATVKKIKKVSLGNRRECTINISH